MRKIFIAYKRNQISDVMVKTELMEKLAKDMKFIKDQILEIKMNVSEINDDIHVVRPGYIEKLNRIRKGKFIRVKNFAERYGIKE